MQSGIKFNIAVGMRTVSEIIKAAGGAQAIEAASNGAISCAAVYKWPSIGVQDRHWGILIALADATPDELYAANLAARAQTSPPALLGGATA